MNGRLRARAIVRQPQRRGVPRCRLVGQAPSLRDEVRSFAADRRRWIERRRGGRSRCRTRFADDRRSIRRRFVDGSSPGLPKRPYDASREDAAVRRRAARGRSEFEPAAGQSPISGSGRSGRPVRWWRRRPSVHARSDRRIAASYRQCCPPTGRSQARRAFLPPSERAEHSHRRSDRIDSRRAPMAVFSVLRRDAGWGRRRAISASTCAEQDQTACPRICLRSCSGVVIGAIWKLSTSTFSTLGVMKAGRLGPNRMFFTPR